MNNTHHSVKTDEDLGQRFARALRENGDTKSSVLRDAILRYVERTEGDTAESINRRIDELQSTRDGFVKEQEKAERKESEINQRIGDLKDRLEDLHADGGHDELFAELVSLKESGANLRVINDKTGKVEKARKLGNYESVESVLEAVVDAIETGDSSE